jgi:hypothetical protein
MMKSKYANKLKRVVCGMAILILSLTVTAFAEVIGSKDGLFWMDVPQDWQWYEDNGGVTIMNPTGNHAIRIDIEARDGIRIDEDANQLVRDAMAVKIQEVALRNGKAVLKTQRKVDGVFSLQSGFIISASDGIRQATAVIFFHGRHLFNIYFEASREFQRLEMEAIVDTIKFEPPKKEEEKIEVRADISPSKVQEPSSQVSVFPAEDNTVAVIDNAL